MDTAYRRPLARAFVRPLCSHSATDPFLLLFFSQEKQSLGGRERVGQRRRRRSEPERTRRRREWSGVNVDVNVRAKNGRYWISAPLASRCHATGLRTDGTEPATSDSMGGGLCSHSRTKAGDFPPGEDEREKAREDDGWIWPFNANNMNDTRGRVGDWRRRRRRPS